MSDIHPCGMYKRYANSGWFGYKPSANYLHKDYLTGMPVLVQWEGCRDRIQALEANIFNTWGFWFCHRKDAGDKVRSFMEEIETKLKITTKTEFGDTEFPQKVLWMKLSPFWMLNLVRRSFLTMALRAGQGYKPKKNNLLECFQEYKYGKRTMPGVELFLNGYTFYRGKDLVMINGWSKLFRDKQENEIKQFMGESASKDDTNQLIAALG